MTETEVSAKRLAEAHRTRDEINCWSPCDLLCAGLDRGRSLSGELRICCIFVCAAAIHIHRRMGGAPFVLTMLPAALAGVSAVSRPPVISGRLPIAGRPANSLSPIARLLLGVASALSCACLLVSVPFERPDKWRSPPFGSAAGDPHLLCFLLCNVSDVADRDDDRFR